MKRVVNGSIVVVNGRGVVVNGVVLGNGCVVLVNGVVLASRVKVKGAAMLEFKQVSSNANLNRTR